MRVATWNLEWAKPGTDRHRRCLEQLESVDADVVVTTEDSLHDWPQYPHRIDGGADWGYRIVGERRKVIAWSREPWRDVVVTTDRPTAGRLVAGTTTVGSAEVGVIGVCIPWGAAHVSTGQRDRRRRDEHIAFCEHLGPMIESTPGPVVVAGDFNQRIPRSGQPVRAFEALSRAIEPLEVPTADDQSVGFVIDHIAIGGRLRSSEVESWPNEISGNRLSDHSGTVVAIV